MTLYLFLKISIGKLIVLNTSSFSLKIYFGRPLLYRLSKCHLHCKCNKLICGSEMNYTLDTVGIHNITICIIYVHGLVLILLFFLNHDDTQYISIITYFSYVLDYTYVSFSEFVIELQYVFLSFFKFVYKVNSLIL